MVGSYEGVLINSQVALVILINKATMDLRLTFLTFIKMLTADSDTQPVVQTTYGKIQGQILSTVQEPHLEYYAFRGIPYAKPPLEELRFQPPLKPEPWENVKPCVDYGNSCLQVSKKDGSVLGNEDCLTLNVFTKELNTSNLKPVMFWIHGGAHIRGSSAQFPPDYLIEKPVVFVSINYRLNIFGFFTVNDENAYGNAALKDQVAALEWVQGNIAGFGGDPSRVTICGESSAANSVALLQLSTRARGLFHQVIAESGSALNARYLQRNPLKYAYNIAKYFNVTTETTRDMVEGLQKVDSEELAKAANSSQATGYKTDLYAFPFFPIIEVENSEAIITRSPYQILQSGDFNRVPFMIGFNTNDGSVGLNIVTLEMNISDFDKYYKLFAPQSLNNERDSLMVGLVVRNHFLGNSSAKNTEMFSQFLGQELLIRGIRKQIDFQRTLSEGYFYRFSYKGSFATDPKGPKHGEELNYLFPKDERTDVDANDKLTRTRMVEMWTNFAIVGSPIPDNKLLGESISWKKCDNTSVYFLDIGDKLILGTNPNETDFQFWNALFQKFGREPYVTY